MSVLVPEYDSLNKSSILAKRGKDSCQNHSKSIKFVMSCGGHADGMKTYSSASVTSQNHFKLFKQQVDGHLQLLTLII